MKRIEIPDEKTQIQSHLVKQADSISDKWIRKYHRRAKFYNRIKPLFKPLKP
jgi:LPS sulfotransferase NodH